MDTIDEYTGKRVRIILKDGYVYVGMVLAQGDTFIKMRDKYDRQILLSLEQIKVLEVLR